MESETEHPRGVDGEDGDGSRGGEILRGFGHPVVT
jgi:hypothetical protein